MEVFGAYIDLIPLGIVAINIALILLCGFIGTYILIKVFRKILKKSNHVDDAIVTFVVNAIKVVCIIVIITIILQLVGVKPATIVTVLGAAGAAIALALRDSLANIAGGFMIIVTHPFNKGDIISVEGDRGQVEEIDLFLTTLKTLDGKTVTIPNGRINTSVVYNESNREIRRVDLSFNIAYDSDVEQVKEILGNVCDANPDILKEPAPCIGVASHNDSGLLIECLVYCETTNYYDVGYYMNESVKTAFEEMGIKQAYPRRDVRIKK